MVQLNSSVIGFCDWLLTTRLYRLTSPQKAVVLSIKQAAQTTGTTTIENFNNFQLFTVVRYTGYLQYQAFVI